MITSCASSPWEVEKATSQSRLISGRYRVESLTGHWNPGNREGLCTLPLCLATSGSHKGTVESFLLSCPSLSSSRQALVEFSMNYLLSYPDLLPLMYECLAADPVQFWLDCSTMPQVIRAVQEEEKGGEILFVFFKISRNYCHGLHKARLALLKSD